MEKKFFNSVAIFFPDQNMHFFLKLNIIISRQNYRPIAVHPYYSSQPIRWWGICDIMLTRTASYSYSYTRE